MSGDKMVTKRIRSEYMKKFKEPKWEAYNKCYEDMLKYRMTRRLLEHTHNPWFWSGSESDSDSGQGSPCVPNKNQIQIEAGGDRADAELALCEQVRRDRWQAQKATTMGGDQRLAVQSEVEDNVSAVDGSKPDGEAETKVLREEDQNVRSRSSKQSASLNRDQVKVGRERPTQQDKSTKQSRRSLRARPVTTRQPRDKSNKDNRHPFALYGFGEKHADIAGRKTHNVCPAASTHEIHESALRARTRREVEREMQLQRSERRRARSLDLNKNKGKRVNQPEFNPWLTEYMRCFSARSR